jgi:polysaccharide biosynthesis/export protein VpsN
MKTWFIYIGVLAIALCVLSFAALAQQPVYTLGSGDELRITVFDEEDLSGKFTVSGEGDLSLPLIGNVMAMGKSLRQLEEDLLVKLADGYLKQPRVNIEVLNYRPFYILGEVNEPGSYPFVNGMTVLNAVALSAGYTNRANKEELTIIRGADATQTPQSIMPEDVILPGDVVRVEERFW